MTELERDSMLIDRMRKRPGLYLGKNSVRYLYVFLSGYSMALNDMGQRDMESEKIAADCPLPYWFFHEFAAKKFGRHESTAGWANIIAEEVGDGTMECWNAFLDIFDEFAGLRIAGCKQAVLSDENIRFCDGRPVTVFRMRNGAFRDGKEYEFPERVFILTLTNGWEMVLVECAESMAAYPHFLGQGGGAAVAMELFGDIDGFYELDIEKLPCEKELIIV